jgi:hypothetical protein
VTLRLRRIERQGLVFEEPVVRLEQTAKFADGLVVAVELPYGATSDDLAIARHELGRLVDQVENDRACGFCFTPFGKVHFLDCPNMPDDAIDDLHAEMDRDLLSRPA